MNFGDIEVQSVQCRKSCWLRTAHRVLTLTQITALKYNGSTQMTSQLLLSLFDLKQSLLLLLLPAILSRRPLFDGRLLLSLLLRLLHIHNQLLLSFRNEYCTLLNLLPLHLSNTQCRLNTSKAHYIRPTKHQSSLRAKVQSTVPYEVLKHLDEALILSHDRESTRSPLGIMLRTPHTLHLCDLTRNKSKTISVQL
jgi:hypothetical protein